MMSNLPTFNQIVVAKSDIENETAFDALLKMYNLFIAYDEPDYYIIDGHPADLREFVTYWCYA